jgi:hypothetical protein
MPEVFYISACAVALIALVKINESLSKNLLKSDLFKDWIFDYTKT